MSGESNTIGGIQPSNSRTPTDALKSGPTPRDVEVLERRHRDRVHSERGKPGEAHRIQRSEAGGQGTQSPGANSGGSVALNVRV